MRLRAGAVFVLLARGLSGSASAQGSPPVQTAATAPSPAPSPSPQPPPRYKLIPYGFESAKDRSIVPLLRFEDRAEVRALEMNAAIARFFDSSDDKGNMMRGATPGGAPTLRDMADYRPHVTPALNLLGAAQAIAKEIKRQIDLRKSMPPADPSPSPGASPAPTPTPKGRSLPF